MDGFSLEDRYDPFLPEHAVVDPSRPPNFPLPIPHTFLWDWDQASPGRASFDMTFNGGSRPRRLRVDWLWALLRLAVFSQRSNRVVLADRVLAMARWGPNFLSDPQWRTRLTKVLLRCSPIGEVQSFGRTGGEKYGLTIDKASPRKCPVGCPLGRSTQLHKHFLFVLPHEYLGSLHLAGSPTGVSLPRGVSSPPVYRYQDFRRKVDGGRYRPEVKKTYRLYAFHAPLAVFGRLAGLNQRQVRLVVSLVGEVTRARRCRRPDRAVVLEGGGASRLPNGKWVPCQGNRGDRYTEKNMYRLVTRMSRAHYRRKGAMTEDRIFAFFNDALRLELELGIHFEIFDSSAQIGSVSQTLECLVAKPSGFDKEELLECEVKAYLPHDYLTSWRDWIGRKTGLTPVITDLSPVLKDNRSDLKKLRFDINSWGKGHKLFAEEAGISAVTLSLYLNGRTKPHPDTVKNIQAAQERINLQTKLLTETKRDNSQYKEEDSGEEADTTSYHDDQPTTNSEPDVQEEARQA